MARFSVGYRTTGVATATLPQASLYATAGVRPRLVECHVSNTTNTAVNLALAKLTTAGTSAAVSAATIYPEDDASQSAIATPRQTHTVAPTITSVGRMIDLAAAIGAAMVWTFGGGKTPGLIVPNTVADGIGIITPNGTGQILSVTWVWDE